jgi:hypothetical protein
MAAPKMAAPKKAAPKQIALRKATPKAKAIPDEFQTYLNYMLAEEKREADAARHLQKGKGKQHRPQDFTCPNTLRISSSQHFSITEHRHQPNQIKQIPASPRPLS